MISFMFIVGFLSGGFIVGLIAISYYSNFKKILTWKIGDRVIFQNEHYTLSGFNENESVIESETFYKRVSTSKLINISAEWRTLKKQCAVYSDPIFSETYKVPDSTNNQKQSLEWRGKDINCLSEIECQIAYKEAVEEDNKELADAILKILNGKFR